MPILKKIVRTVAMTGLVAVAALFVAPSHLVHAGNLVEPSAAVIKDSLDKAAGKTHIPQQSLQTYIKNFVSYGLGFLTFIALGIILYNGARVLTAGGKKEVLGEAWKSIGHAFLGIVIISISASAVNFVGVGIDAILSAKSGVDASKEVSTGGNAVLGQASQVIADTPMDKTIDPQAFVLTAIKYVLSLVGVVAIIFVIYGGIRWMTSAGSPEIVKEAQLILKNALIGLVLIIFSLAIVNFAQNIMTIVNSKSATTSPAVTNTTTPAATTP